MGSICPNPVRKRTSMMQDIISSGLGPFQGRKDFSFRSLDFLILINGRVFRNS